LRFGFLTSLDTQETNVEAATADLTSPPRRLTPAERRAERAADELYENHRGIEYHFPPAAESELTFRHAADADKRAKIRAAVQFSYNAVKLQHFDNCGSSAWVEREANGKKLRITCNKCRDRWCPACGRERSNLIAGNLSKAIEGQEIRFITLTLRHNENPLPQQLDRLNTCFRNLRNRKFWKAHVDGGAAFIELKRSQDDRTWHPHLHVVATGKYIPHTTLSGEWLAVTGDSHVVDIRAAQDKEKVVRYVAKYATKPTDPTIYNSPQNLLDAIAALKGRRLCTTFGTMRGVKLEEKPAEDIVWIRVGALADIIQKSKEGDLGATAVLEILKRKRQTKKGPGP
jgi:hypothetical protein